MTRVVVLTIFTLIAISLLNLRGGDPNKASKSYFNIEEYSKSYQAEIDLQAELAAPKVVEVKEEMAEVKKEPEVILTTETQLRGQKL